MRLKVLFEYESFLLRYCFIIILQYYNIKRNILHQSMLNEVRALFFYFHQKLSVWRNKSVPLPSYPATKAKHINVCTGYAELCLPRNEYDIDMHSCPEWE